jgi:hypothetical protein
MTALLTKRINSHTSHPNYQNSRKNKILNKSKLLRNEAVEKNKI